MPVARTRVGSWLLGGRIFRGAAWLPCQPRLIMAAVQPVVGQGCCMHHSSACSTAATLSSGRSRRSLVARRSTRKAAVGIAGQAGWLGGCIHAWNQTCCPSWSCTAAWQPGGQAAGTSRAGDGGVACRDAAPCGRNCARRPDRGDGPIVTTTCMLATRPVVLTHHVRASSPCHTPAVPTPAVPGACGRRSLCFTACC